MFAMKHNSSGGEQFVDAAMSSRLARALKHRKADSLNIANIRASETPEEFL